MSKTSTFTLTPTVYTDISEGATNVLLKIVSNASSVRLAFANTSPDANTASFISLNNGNPYLYPLEVEPGSRLYARSNIGANVDVQVVSGNYGSSVSSTVPDAGPAQGAVVVTPSDSTVLSHVTRALWVGTVGNVTVVMSGGQTVTFTNVQGLLPVSVSKVMLTGTTASNITAMW